jgi:hypothetical protein
MSERDRATGDRIVGRIGNVSGQAAIGKAITQTHVASGARPEVTEADLAELQRLLASLRVQVEAEAPPDKKEQALERVGELEEAVQAKEPDLSTMEYVRNWFAKNLPKMAGAVTGVVIHPIVGALVAAVGQSLADEYRRRFGVEPDQP